jgi:predicted DNA-binding protein (UPF0251 family)
MNTDSARYLAGLRLEEVQGKRGRTDLQVAAASEAVARADRNAEAAEIKLLLATDALNAAKAEAARKSAEEAAATEAQTESLTQNSGAMQGNISGVQILIGLAPLILAAAAPIGAAAIGLGTSFGVMAAAGTAAVAGIKNEMNLGTTAGDTYAAGLQGLTVDLQGLESTSAVAMLGAFNQAVGDINSHMPFLNQLVGTASAQLGNMGGIALQGVLNGLQAMNPLIMDAGTALSQFVGWLAQMTSSNGFTQFIAYAQANLPGTMQLIEELVTLAGNILAAFAPLGPVVLGFLNGFVSALNTFPLPVLAGIVTSATLIAPALRLAFNPAIAAAIDTVAASIGVVGVTANLAVPIVGILTAAIAGIAVATLAAAASTQQAVVVTQDYTQALKDDNNTIGEHVRLMAAKALSDSGAFDAAQKLGISQKTLTDATLGVAGAQDKVNSAVARAQGIIDAHASDLKSDGTAMNDAGKAADGLQGAISTVTTQLGTNSGAIAKGKQENVDMAAAMAGATGAASDQTQAVQTLAGQFGNSVSDYGAAVQAQKAAADQYDATTAAMQQQNDAAGVLKQALDKLNGKAISAADAQNAFDSSLANMGDHLSSTGKKITFTTTSINDMSAASVALRGQLNGQVSNLEAVAEANGGFANSTGAARDQMVTMRQQIIDNAVAHGVNRDAVTAYIDKILQIPQSVPPTKLDVDTANADAAIEAFKQHLASINNRTVQVTTDYVSNGKDTGVANTTNVDSTPGIVKYNASGGQVSYLAGGGTPFPGGPKGTDTVPTWLTPGEIVMNTASVKSLGADNLLTANRTGQWPGGGQTPNITVYVTNPFTGEQVQAVVQSVANAAINGANRDARYRRVGV